MDPYKELGVTPESSEEEIKRRFKTLAQIYHPDKGGNPEKFLLIKECYEILMDPKRKKILDTMGVIKEKTSDREDALQELAALLSQHINNLDPEENDLILEMTKSLEKVRNDTSKKIQNAKNLQNKFKKFSSNLRFKSNKENFLDRFIKYKINQLSVEIVDNTRSLDILDIMESMLSDYEYILIKKLKVDEDGQKIMIELDKK